MRHVKILAILIFVLTLSIKIGSAQKPVKQYVAVDVEVFNEMQRVYKTLQSKLREIEALEEKVKNLERALKELKAESYRKEVSSDEEEDYYF